MKKFIITILLIFSMFIPTVYAQDGNVTYDGDAQKFIFAPGSEYSLTDLFSNFKDVMPGDVITQKITVKNDASNDVKVKIYMRSLGAHEDSKDFLSQMHLYVKKSDENEMGYMFDASSEKSDGLSDWTLLGTLYSGGEVNLDVLLSVPVEMDSTYMNKIGYLDWQFKVEEFPIEESDPEGPGTSDTSNRIIYISMFILSMFIVLLLKNKKQYEN